MKRFKKILLYIAVVIAVIAAALIVYGFKGDIEESVEYSSYSVEGDGTKALYLLAGKMGYDVQRYTRPSRFLPENATLVAIEPNLEMFNSNLERKYLKAWLEKGNDLILISYEGAEDLKELGTIDQEDYGLYGSGYKFRVGEGSLIYFPSSENYANSGLKELDFGVQFIEALEETKNKTVLFNEYLHGIGNAGANLWDILGSAGRLVVVQLFMCVLIFIFIKSRRFGKPVVVFETIKRKENENLFALSNIYFRAKANSMALEIYLDNLKAELAKFLGFGKEEWNSTDIVKAARVNITLKDLDVDTVFADCDRYINNRKGDSKVLINLYKRLEIIRKGIK
ncbi:MAG: hypothetical protein BWY74_03385 [Firmicutes bacterium ADurb.Bin419]|nr:MAG: hypothetical protein BWY74_03385 [Firmicutes bacterium ADurb.Bin419]